MTAAAKYNLGIAHGWGGRALGSHCRHLPAVSHPAEGAVRRHNFYGLKPWLYSSVLVEYGLLWFTMLAAPWLARNKAHVFIDAITQMLPPAVQQVLAKFVYLVCVVMSFVVCYYSSSLFITAVAEGQIDTRAVDMPLWALYAPIPPCFLLVGIEFLRFLLGFDSMYGSRSDVKEGA
jgi:C4-dicarboxylate transporter DctQ subunit